MARMLKKRDRAYNVERELLRWGLYTGVLPCTMDESGRLRLSVASFTSASITLALANVGYSYASLYYKKNVIVSAVVIVALVLNALKTTVMLLTTKRRIKTAENCLATFREIDVICGPVEIEGWSVYRTRVCMLLPLVVNTTAFLGMLLLRNSNSTHMTLHVLGIVLMRAVHMTYEMTFNILMNALGTRVHLSMKHDATDTGDSGFIERRLRSGCIVQRLVRLRERELCASYGPSLLLVVVTVSCDFIIVSYFIIGIYSKASVLQMTTSLLLLSMHLWELLIVADPCDRLNLYYERSLNEMNFALSAHSSRLAPSSYRELRHWLGLLGSDGAGGQTRVLDLFCLGRAVLLPVVSFASTYVIVLVQIYDGSI